MNNVGVLWLVLAASYGVNCLVLSVVVALSWSQWFNRTALTARSLLAMRLLPSMGALCLTLFVVLPAFLINEPKRAAEPVGPVVMLMAAFALVCIGAGCLRARRSWLTTARLLRDCDPTDSGTMIAGRDVHIVDWPGALFAVVGACKPRIVAASRVLEVCSHEELREVIGHEAAHIAARDNLKLLLLLASPDPLAWIPVGTGLLTRWRSAVEFEADAIATGPDPRRRVALASALIKVARLSDARGPLATLSMPIVAEDVEGRVRRLLAPSPAVLSTLSTGKLAAFALFLPLVVMPFYGSVQECIEALVAFGR